MSLRKLKRRKKQNKKHINIEAAQRYYDLARDQISQGLHKQAESLLRKALHNNPGHTEALNSLGNTLHTLGKTDEALAAYCSVCQQMADNPQAHYNYGTTLFETGDSFAAVSELQKTIQLDSNHADAYASLGVVYQSMGQLDQAKKALEHAIHIDPHFDKAHRFLGLVLKDLGDTRAATAKFTEILKKNPHDAFSRYLLSRYTKYSSTKEAEVDLIQSQLASPSTTVDDTTFLHFTLGKIFDDLTLYQDAFDHYTQGNKKKRATFGKHPITPGIPIKQLKSTFTPELYSRFSGHGNQSETPVFIVGMPRSGTTLVEQICASHSAVHGAGELKEMGKIRQILQEDKGVHNKKPKRGRQTFEKQYPECLATVQPQSISSLAARYLTFIQRGIPAETLRVTDKMPTNFIELGLIRILFPKARIIHCLRDPRDTCLSNFFQNFEEGNECSFNLDELIFYYKKYRELMTFWKKILPGSFYEIQYEELVANSEEQSKKLIAYLDLPWEESCLSFFKTKRMVHTSSDWQVRQPIYTKSVHRWKNYEEQINWHKLDEVG